MRAFLLIVTAIAALVVVGPASATPTEGVHGAGVFELSAEGLQGKLTVAVHATRTPSGEVTGHMNFLVTDTVFSEFSALQAEPSYLEVNGDAACVVGNVTRLTSWDDRPPAVFVFKVVDVAGGPDKILPFYVYGPIDPALACGFVGEPNLSIAAGNFTVLP